MEFCNLVPSLLATNKNLRCFEIEIAIVTMILNINGKYFSLTDVTFILLFQIIFFPILLWLSRQGQQNTPTASLLRSKTPPNECPGYDTKQSNGEAPVMIEFGGMQGTPLLSSLASRLWPGVVAPKRILSMGQIELNSVFMLNWTVWSRIVYMYKNGFCINQKWLIRNKTQPTNQPTNFSS